MYVNNQTGERATLADIRRANPHTMFPRELDSETLAFLGYALVAPTARPSGDVVTEAAPELIDGQWRQVWSVRDYTPEERAAMLDDAKRARSAENNAAYESAIAALTADYPPSEIATWERQRAEALAWAADTAAPTPWIDIAAAARGLDRGEYLSRTLAKAQAFAQASAWLTGRRQGIDDALRAATTPAELAAVVIDYTLPA
ncbi:hypothetical protein [Roseovarius sp.]|uniref:hypothetical protein n=1 Tax=Roseovarius sp. TaxID=1486281 RepID=UPI003A96E647